MENSKTCVGLTLSLLAVLGLNGRIGWAGAQDSIDRQEFPAWEYTVSGDVGGLIEAGEVVMTRPTAVLGELTEMSRTQLKGGQFLVHGQSRYSSVATLVVLDAEDTPRGSVQFVLEPGAIRVEYASEAAGLRVRGGRMNNRITGSWEDREEYRLA